MTILQSNTRPLSKMRRCLTSQYSRTSGAVKLCVLVKPYYITLISFSYCRSPRPAAQIRSGDFMVILLLPANVAIKAVSFIISLIMLDLCISDWDGFAGNLNEGVHNSHWVVGNCVRASVLLPGAVLDGQLISQGFFLQSKQLGILDLAQISITK